MKINRENLKPLGHGGEKRVYENPNNPEQAIGIFHKSEAESAELAKARFYLTKIMHLLFPKNVPDMYLAASNPSFIIVDKVESKDKIVTNEHQYASELRDVVSKIESVGTKLDDNWFNFKFNKSGDIAYVDSFRPWYTGDDGIIKPEFDMEKLEAAIQNLDDDKRELASTYFKRLEESFEKASVDSEESYLKKTWGEDTEHP